MKFSIINYPLSFAELLLFVHDVVVRKVFSFSIKNVSL